MFSTPTLDELYSNLKSNDAISSRDHDKEAKTKTQYTSLGLALDIDETLSATNLAWFQRLIKLFGNDPNDTERSELSLIEEFHLAQHVPWWKENPDAVAWMDRQRKNPKAQDNLPLIEGSLEGVKSLLNNQSSNIFLVAYITVRPSSVNTNTIRWLQENGFPPLPVLAKPDSVPFEKGNQWKAHCLKRLYPYCKGIVDDNPKLPRSLQAGTFYSQEEGDIISDEGDLYQGVVFMFGHQDPPPIDCDKVGLPCATWPDVVRKVEEWSKIGYISNNHCRSGK